KSDLNKGERLVQYLVSACAPIVRVSVCAGGRLGFHNMNSMATNTRSAIHAVSTTMSPTGRQPTMIKSLNDVFMPRAAIAVTRHALETVVARLANGGVSRPMLSITTRAAKPRRNIGMIWRLRDALLNVPRDVTQPTMETTGRSMATRNSFT